MRVFSGTVNDYFILGLVIFIGVYVLIRILTHRREHSDIGEIPEEMGPDIDNEEERSDEGLN